MAEGSERFELHKQHSAGQDKYTYFLLAAAASGIAFAVTKTEGLAASWWLTPVGLAITAWAVSFYAGCRAVQWTQACIGANYNLLCLQSGTHPDQPPTPQTVAAAMRGVEKALASNATNVELWCKVQFRSLVAGGILFIGWRIAEMVRVSMAMASAAK
ncbi:MAG: hypothetical protein AB7H88_11785 [Vicinamibacterales bacterium]